MRRVWTFSNESIAALQKPIPSSRSLNITHYTGVLNHNLHPHEHSKCDRLWEDEETLLTRRLKILDWRGGELDLGAGCSIGTAAARFYAHFGQRLFVCPAIAGPPARFLSQCDSRARTPAWFLDNAIGRMGHLSGKSMLVDVLRLGFT
jgi:hypothetical protein